MDRIRNDFLKWLNENHKGDSKIMFKFEKDRIIVYRNNDINYENLYHIDKDTGLIHDLRTNRYIYDILTLD